MKERNAGQVSALNSRTVDLPRYVWPGYYASRSVVRGETLEGVESERHVKKMNSGPFSGFCDKVTGLRDSLDAFFGSQSGVLGETDPGQLLITQDWKRSNRNAITNRVWSFQTLGQGSTTQNVERAI